MNLTLERPLVILDTETTGVEPGIDRIVQIGLIRIEPDGSQEERCWLVNPKTPIPPEATAIHHITDGEVAGSPPFAHVWPQVAQLLEGADFCAYNARFDLGMIEAECTAARIKWTRPERVIDPMVIFRNHVPHTLAGALDHYAGAPHEDAHDALGDCRATLRVLRVQWIDTEGIESADDLVAASTPAKDDRFCDSERKFYWRFAEPVFAFGKWRGTPLARVARNDAGYLTWMLKQEYADDVKDLIRKAMRGESLVRAVA